MEPMNPTPQETVTPKKSNWVVYGKEWLWFFLKVIILFLIIRTFIITAFIVSGPSMVPTFHDKDYLIVERLSYLFKEPNRGDVVVVNETHLNKNLIKRIVGLPGETIYSDGIVTTIVNAQGTTTLQEPYISDTPGVVPNRYQGMTLKTDEYFVMGDNRAVSKDSRDLGPITKKQIIGRPLLRLLPFSAVGVYPGHLIEEKK